MYVCPNCKKEYETEVTFCSACGTKVEPLCVAPVVHKEPAVIALFAFLTKLVNIVVAFCAGLSLADPYIDVKTSSSKYSSYIYAIYHTNEGWATAAFMFAFTAIGLAIASLIIACAKKAEQKSKFNAITNLVVSSLLFVFSIVLLSFA
jgi:hypothetical protein